MKDTPTTPAEKLAASFQVAELEPRLENVWGAANPVPVDPSGPSGQGTSG